MDDSRKIDTAFKLLDNVQNLIKFADTKINVLLVVSGVTTSFVLTNFQNLYDLNWIAKLLLMLFFLVFFIFVILSLQTISPRSDKHTGDTPPKTIYFKHIAKRIECKDFVADYNQLTLITCLTDVLYQIYENSRIADKKFAFYNRSLIALQVQMVLFFLLLVLRFFPLIAK